jgi:hypothetical protein
MVGELDRVWKEGVVTYSRYYPGSILEGLRKITKVLRIPVFRP